MTENTYDPHAAFQANLQKAEADMKQAGLDPKGHAPGQVHQSQQATPTVNQALLEKANAMQIEKDENGRRRYHEDSAFRAEVEAIRMQAFGGPAVPVAQQPAPAPVDPQGSPADRLEAEIRERIENNEVISPADYGDEMFREYAAGYDVADLLGNEFGFNAEHSAMLHAAREAGIPASSVRATIARLIKDQQ